MFSTRLNLSVFKIFLLGIKEMSIEVVILAAGQGSRMKSALPKVLHTLANKPLVKHVVDTAKSITAEKIHVVVGHGAEKVKSTLAEEPVDFALQAEQLGTGHAVAQTLNALNADSKVLILYGDVPLTAKETLEEMLNVTNQETIGLLTVNLENPTGYGRIVRDENEKVMAIVEHKDASPEQLMIQEVNSGILCVPANYLKDWLPQLSNENAQGEYYLTDVIEMSVAKGLTVQTVQPNAVEETQGVNNRVQLAELERWYQQQLANELMVNGATLRDPARVDVRGHVSCGRDALIDINVIFEGEVTLGENVSIGANCIIKNSTIGDGVRVEANSLIEDSVVEAKCVIGPYARLRPGTQMAEAAKVGNFVEVKKSVIGPGSKVNHLSYIGDAEVGSEVNVGAGTITCNYDGVNKSKTTLEDGVFIGSNTALVAPVTVGKNATVGAGSVVTKNVGDDTLAIARARQTTIDGWKRPVKEDK